MYQSISSNEHLPFFSEFFTYQLDFSVFSPWAALNLIWISFEFVHRNWSQVLHNINIYTETKQHQKRIKRESIKKIYQRKIEIYR